MDTRRRPALLGVAVGGVLTGHWLTYLVVSPDVHDRAALMRDTGHAYLGLLNDTALVLALVAFASIFLGRLTRGEVGQKARIAAWVVGFQAAAFSVMELLERVTAGDAVRPLLHGPVLPVGIAVQVVVGLALAAIITLLLRVADRVSANLGAGAPVPRRPGIAFAIWDRHVAGSASDLFATGVRGPPSTV